MPAYPDNAKEKVVVGVSGGIDSAVATLLLKQAGHEVVAAHLRLYDGASEAENASLRRHEEEACEVARAVGVPIETVDLRREFAEQVITPFIDAYQAGVTPNPCAGCNPAIKFGLLRDWAFAQGAAAISTGHYVRSEFNSTLQRHQLKRAADTMKDQSYFLCRLRQEQIATFLTPLGGMTKDQTRALALEHRLPASLHAKPESQEICFIPDNDYAGFIMRSLGASERELNGPVHDTTGKVVGEHRGIHRYTIGQRRGLGISAPQPLYVVAIDAAKNTVVVGPEDALYRRELPAIDPVWSGIAQPSEPCRAMVKIRYRTPPAPALVTPGADGAVDVTFDAPQRAITPGQVTAFYDPSGQTLWGGAWIDALPAY